MRWICFRDHEGYGPDGTLVPAWNFIRIWRGPRKCGSFGAWLFCRAFYHADDRWRNWLVRKGFVDANGEGQTAFWRWDFWNAHMRAELEAIERREWEQRRAEAVARRGA